MIAAHQTMMGGAPLPYDAEVEYLEGVTGGYIVLPWAFATTDRWEMDAQFSNISANSYNGAFYNFSNVERVDIAYENGTKKFRINYGPGNDLVAGDTNRHIFILDAKNNRCSIDSTIYSLPGTHVSVPSNRAFLGILGRLLVNNASTLPAGQPNAPGTGCMVYSSRIYRNDVVQLDLIPVRVGSGSSAVGYLYDRVSGTLFGNAGTGAFPIGPDK